MLFSFHLLGPLSGPSSARNFLPGRPEKGGPIELALAEESVAVRAEVRVPGAGRKGPDTSADAIRFFPVQFTRAPPNQHSVLVIHAFFPFRQWAR